MFWRTDQTVAGPRRVDAALLDREQDRDRQRPKQDERQETEAASEAETDPC